MNRSRTIPRDIQYEGSERSQQLGLALAAKCDPLFLEALLTHVSALDEFGGEFYVSSARKRFDLQGNVVEGEGGQYETIAYVFAYNKRSRIKGEEVEPDASYTNQSVDLPEPDSVEERFEDFEPQEKPEPEPARA